VKFQLQKFNVNVPENELIADVKRVAFELKKNSLTTDEYEENGNFDISTIKRRLGSWLKVLEKAGLQQTDKQTKATGIPEEELFKNLEELWVKLGRQPRSREAITPLSEYDITTYKRRFGSWMKALEKFVAYMNKEENVSSEKGIQNLQIGPLTKHKTSRGINWRLRFLIMRRDNFKCKNCGRSPATDPSIILHVDHIKAWANRGETILDNLQTLCSKCNIGKSDLDQ